MKIYTVHSIRTISSALIVANNETEVKELLKYNYNLSDGNITAIGTSELYAYPDIIILNESNDPLWD